MHTHKNKKNKDNTTKTLYALQHKKEESGLTRLFFHCPLMELLFKVVPYCKEMVDTSEKNLKRLGCLRVSRRKTSIATLRRE